VIVSVGSNTLDAFARFLGRCFFAPASPSLPSLLGSITGLAGIFLFWLSPLEVSLLPLAAPTLTILALQSSVLIVYFLVVSSCVLFLQFTFFLSTTTY
jgi:hypothetical protein